MAANGEHMEQKTVNGEKFVHPVDENILNLFWKIAEVENETRISATFELVRSLENISRENEVNAELSPEIVYSIKRLVKGLASSRKAARHGFYLALVELLHNFSDVEVEYVYKCLKEAFNTEEKEEKKNNLIGMLLGSCALLRCGKELPDPVVSGIVKVLHHAVSKKPELELFSVAILQELFETINEKQFESCVLPEIRTCLESGWKSATPWSFWIILKAHALFKNIINKDFLSAHWESLQLINKSTYTNIGQIIMQSTSVHPHIHPVCTLVFESTLASKKFNKMWLKIVDDVLVPSQKERVYLAYELAKRIIPLLTSPEQIETVLSHNFIRSFINNLHSPHSMLHTAANYLANFLMEYVSNSEDSSMQYAIISCLLKTPGTMLFDAITNTKTVSNMIAKLKTDAMKSLSEFLINYVCDPLPSDDSLHKNSMEQCSQALQMLSRLLCHSAVQKDQDWQCSVFRFLFLHGFFNVSRKNLNEIIEDKVVKKNVDAFLRNSFCENFFRGLNFLSQLNPLHSKLSVFHYCEILYNITDFVNTLMFNLHLELLVPLNEEALNCWITMFKKIKELRSSLSDNTDKKNQNTVFQVLLMQMALQLFIEQKETVPVLEELFICCSKANVKKRVSLGRVEEEPHWIEVMVDLLVGLLSQNQRLLRTVVGAVFTLLSPYVTISAMKQVLDVIDPQKAIDDEGPLVEETLSDEGGEEADDNDEGEMEIDDDEHPSSSSDDDEDLESKEEKMKVNDELRAAVQAALGNNVADSDMDLSDVDEDELNRLDEALSEVFKTHKKKSSQNAETLMHFRIRCVDLIESVLSNHPTLPIMLCVATPLVSALEFSLKNKDQKPLYNRIHSLLKKLGAIKKFHKAQAPAESQDMLEMWKELVSRAGKASCVEISDLIAHLTSSLASALISSNEDNFQNKEMKLNIYSHFKSQLDQFLSQRNHNLHENYFISFMKRQPEFCEEIIPLLLSYIIGEEISVYKKTKALTLLRCQILSRQEIITRMSAEEWQTFTDKLISYEIQVLDKIQDKTDVKPLFLAELFKLHESVMAANKSKENQELKIIASDALMNAMTKCPKEVKKILRRILTRYQAPSQTPSKKRKGQISSVTGDSGSVIPLSNHCKGKKLKKKLKD